MSTDQFFADVGTDEVRFQFFQFGSGSNQRTGYLTTFTESKEKTYRWVTFAIAAHQQLVEH
jgi:hypothetical protein